MITSIDLFTILPELILAVLGMALLMYGVFRGDKAVHSVSWLAVGAILITAIAISGQSDSGQVAFKGQFIVDLESFIFESPARWTIQALVDTTIYSISKEDYERIGDVVPNWHKLEKLFLIRCFSTMENRIFSHLSMTAEERYKLFFEGFPELFNQVPLQYIASLLGMTPETFSRVRKKLML